ncbi:hypothetical protein Desaci_3936 [Desulfosporosinus acidiphilus SJ4]|uniref:Uncharacterized protein n=1 Tax=Desulfosporosinus acidiphilus (strain DSM 22704 / JCM 16185 / SJ4) TaxID=646529 RepID=I4DAI5_DESAJ|nr:hypothetical protein [Desulfosporosinus acidiphilus]AFM42809.1 hypothetical protein Desaci_3936 [Desulfosporosinus acidiphilus SJ4]
MNLNLSKIALVLFGSVTLLTVGAPIASASPAYPKIYRTTQPAGQNQPVSDTQQFGLRGTYYAPSYGNWSGPMNSNYWQDYNWDYYPGNNGGNMWQSGDWSRGCW